ncbi:hypothetical protein CAOG_000843 [Capsaspora owczarzaki ATCC 30864]|uniref:Importin N-terminal domain-containing protein n=2 Tax=Capsaspora owczarzaki (strain ATCC 30864) TaxID=595528 RepID=A0A0D2VHB9_CAPO3|nr:hypothetical protein CAOG_000843 [Capsaspora owczarzaki ATCC 30864]
MCAFASLPHIAWSDGTVDSGMFRLARSLSRCHCSCWHCNLYLVDVFFHFVSISSSSVSLSLPFFSFFPITFALSTQTSMDPSLDPATSQPLEAELQPFVQVCVAAGTAVSTEQMVEIEQWLNAAATTPGFTVSLLRIAINSTVEPNARLFAATQLKVRLQKAVATFTAAHGAYASRDADLAAALHEFQNTVPREDLVVLANNVLQSLASCSDSKIRAQLAVVVDSLVYANKYSEYWTDLLATVRTFLSDGRPAYQQAAATTLDCFADSYYNLDTDEEKAAVQAMLEATFPFIVHHLQSATTVATHEHRKLCCDLLNTLQQLTVYSLPSHLVASIEQFLSWFQPVMHIAAMPISEPAWAYQQAINLDPEADENEVLHSEWTLKRKAFKLFMKLHTRYGLRENATPEYEAFADAFEQSLSVPLQLITLQTFEQSEARGIRLAIGVARHGWTFLLNVMSVKGCWQQLKPFLPIVLAQLCEWQRFVDEELEDMEDDPIYFLSFHDDADSFKSTVPDVARQFLYELCYRRTSMVFEDINNFIQQRMNAQPAPTPDDMEAAKAKVATMRMAFIACRVMRSRKAYQPMLEPALLYFFPAELTSPHPMVRFVALWCLRNFCLVYKFKKIETPAAILQASMPLLHDPVAVVALEAFNLVSTLARESPICRPLFVAELEPMVTRLVNLMQTSKVRFPSIPTYLSQFVQSYSTEMTSLAGLVLQHLYQSFVRAMTDESDPEAADEDEAQGGAPDALNALEAMQEILYAYEDADTPYANEVVFAAAQPSVFQLLMDVVSHHLANYLEGALELVTSVISNQQQVSPDVVALFSKIFENYHSHYLSYTPGLCRNRIPCAQA